MGDKLNGKGCLDTGNNVCACKCVVSACLKCLPWAVMIHLEYTSENKHRKDELLKWSGAVP